MPPTPSLPLHSIVPAHRGFTLVELMVVVAIVAVLATVATIAYQRHLRSGRIVSAQAVLAQLQSGQETYFQQFGVYCDASQGGNYHPPLQAGIEPVAKRWSAGAPPLFGNLGVMPEGDRTHAAFFVAASLPVTGEPLTMPTTSHQVTTVAGKVGIPGQPTTAGMVVHPWYYVVAHLDLNGNQSGYVNGACSDGIAAKGCTVMTATSVSSAIVVRNQGD